MFMFYQFILPIMTSALFMAAVIVLRNAGMFAKRNASDAVMTSSEGTALTICGAIFFVGLAAVIRRKDRASARKSNA